MLADDGRTDCQPYRPLSWAGPICRRELAWMALGVVVTSVDMVVVLEPSENPLAWRIGRLVAVLRKDGAAWLGT